MQKSLFNIKEYERNICTSASQEVVANFVQIKAKNSTLAKKEKEEAKKAQQNLFLTNIYTDWEFPDYMKTYSVYA